jgi:hypothetical protein
LFVRTTNALLSDVPRKSVAGFVPALPLVNHGTEVLLGGAASTIDGLTLTVETIELLGLILSVLRALMRPHRST